MAKQEVHHPLTAVQREDVEHELDVAADRMQHILQLMTAVYGSGSEEVSRAEQIVNAVIRLQRELGRNQNQMKSAGA